MFKFRLSVIIIILGALAWSCNTGDSSHYQVAGPQSKIIADMIEAVNEKDAAKYVNGFAEDVSVYVDSELKVSGRQNLKNNRANHFENHPDVKSRIQHLVEIDNKVILHDKVWLDKSDKEGQDIVEIFTFHDGEVTRVDVIQPNDLFNRQQ